MEVSTTIVFQLADRVRALDRVLTYVSSRGLRTEALHYDRCTGRGELRCSGSPALIRNLPDQLRRIVDVVDLRTVPPEHVQDVARYRLEVDGRGEARATVTVIVDGQRWLGAGEGRPGDAVTMAYRQALQLAAEDGGASTEERRCLVGSVV